MLSGFLHTTHSSVYGFHHDLIILWLLLHVRIVVCVVRNVLKRQNLLRVTVVQLYLLPIRLASLTKCGILGSTL